VAESQDSSHGWADHLEHKGLGELLKVNHWSALLLLDQVNVITYTCEEGRAREQATCQFSSPVTLYLLRVNDNHYNLLLRDDTQ
jgi:hypothetical protein